MTQFIIFLIIGLLGVVAGYYIALRRKTGKVRASIISAITHRACPPKL